MRHEDQVNLLYLIKELELAVRSRLDAVVGAAGLTTIQYTALTVLRAHPDMTSAALARRSFVRAQTMAELVATLEDRRLIERRPDPTSKRQNLIRLTSEGTRVLDELREPVARIEHQMTAGTAESRIASTRKVLGAWRDGLTASTDVNT